MKELGQNDPLTIELRASEKRHSELVGMRANLQRQLDNQLENLRALRTKDERIEQLDYEATLLRVGSAPERAVVKRVDELQHEIEVIDRAIQQQTAIVNQVRGQFSIALCHVNEAEYVGIEKEIAKAVQALAAANEVEANFFDDLRDAGCSSISFRPMRVSVIGTFRDENSLASRHEREMKEFCPKALH